MQFESGAFFATTVGGSTLLGGLMGFAAKKLAKLVIAIIGAELAFLAVLEQQGVITVEWDQLAAWLQPPSSAAELDPGLLDVVLSTGLIGGGFAGGFAVGFHKG